jgi:hypothetical protein
MSAQTTKQILWIYVSSNYKTNTVDLCQFKGREDKSNTISVTFPQI